MILFLLPLTPALSAKGRGVLGSIFDKGLFGAESAEKNFMIEERKY